MIDLIKEAKNLLNNLDKNSVSPSAYDTAWVARIADEKDPSKPMFPSALDWLLKNQHKDGSWGGKIEYYHDRIICTLSTILALFQYNKNRKYQRQIEKGIKYIKKNIKNLRKDHHAPVGFELIFPKLINDIKDLGFRISGIDKEIIYYQKIQEQKLKLAPNIYSRSNLIIHAAELLGDNLNLALAKKRQDIDGSLAGSPSATAYFFIKSKNRQALNYLKKVIEASNSKAPPIYPIEIFEKAWVLYNFFYVNLLDKLKSQIRPHLEYLQKTWTRKGVSHTKYYYLTDADDTSIVFNVLENQKSGVLNPSVFENFETKTHFATWPYERDLSTSSHIHLLDALKNCVGYPQQKRMIKKILKILYKTRIKNSYWFDKWHISPYYPTSHAVLATVGIDNKLAQGAINWILKTQKRDGSWGYFKEMSTLEETAYCLQALIYYSQKIKPVKKEIIKRARDYLYKNYFSYSYPELGIAKSLYCPYNVVKSAIISALLMAEQI